MSGPTRFRSYVGARLRNLLPVDWRVSFSQEGEDLMLERLMGAEYRNNGFFVDVGAHHPTRYSNTYRFYRRGWRGMNIDARPGTKRLFDRQRPRDINIECGVAREPGSLEFIEFNEPALNTFSAEEAARKCHPPYRIVRRSTVPVLPLAELLQRHLPAGQEIDFMSIDVEGLDEEVVASSDWQRFRPRLVLVEMLGVAYEQVPEEGMGKFLRAAGYRPVAKACNTVMFERA